MSVASLLLTSQFTHQPDSQAASANNVSKSAKRRRSPTLSTISSSTSLSVFRSTDHRDNRASETDNPNPSKKRMLSPALSSNGSSTSSSIRATHIKDSASRIAEIATPPLGLSPILQNALNQRNGSQRESNEGDKNASKKAKVGSGTADQIEEISRSEASSGAQKGSAISELEFNGGVYSGPVSWGIPHGEGKWEDPKGFTYFCNFNCGILEGYGRVLRPDNSMLYKGDLKQNKPNGKGTYFLKNGHIFLGNLINGFFEGPGKVFTSDGDFVYEGGFTSGNYHGQGLLKENGYTYNGNFVRGRRHGYCEVTGPDGKSLFQGDYLNDKIHDEEDVVNTDWEYF